MRTVVRFDALLRFGESSVPPTSIFIDSFPARFRSDGFVPGVLPNSHLFVLGKFPFRALKKKEH